MDAATRRQDSGRTATVYGRSKEHSFGSEHHQGTTGSFLGRGILRDHHDHGAAAATAPAAVVWGTPAGWPTALSYAVSYILIVIMWINHHVLGGYAQHSTPRLILWNFVHMFAASLVPFATAWVADTRMAPVPVFVYAAVIVMVNLSYHVFAYDIIPDAASEHGDRAPRRIALARSMLTMALFTGAMLLSLEFPHAAFLLVTCVLLTYARPEVPRVR
jgi:uncharacterized membrane protein